MSLLKFLRNGQAAQTAVDELVHGAPAGAKGHEMARTLATRIESKFVGDEIDATIKAGIDVIAAVSNQKQRFGTMQPSDRRLAADSLEQLGRCAFTLAGVLRGEQR